jgi:hypothetical protein
MGSGVGGFYRFLVCLIAGLALCCCAPPATERRNGKASSAIYGDQTQNMGSATSGFDAAVGQLSMS